ncbi:MAG: ATP-binding cassette domain-containing protein, partial [Flammeovirgaceae bacterium]|nr:ATP-binding cassette domain-containing protein [Flammeovirgaceae bacterium]MDW8288577.1 ATP-binding cassette domain-containing protein [Flammeovirgaceae bacterium]
LEHPLLVRRAVGYLPEHNPLYLDMYVPEALYFAASVFGIRGKILREKVSAMIELVGLEPEKHKKVGALSKGYRQRVGLAQALIHEPRVLILDEPTTGLDPNQIVEIRQLIKRISQQKTVLLSTHLMQEVQALCQRVIILNKGKIVADSAIDVLKQEKSQVTTVVELTPDSNPHFLQHIPHVERIEKIGENTYQLTPQDGKDLRAEIFRQAVANNATLLSLFLQDVSLEKIFQQLTR